jgi:hypothetical protein
MNPNELSACLKLLSYLCSRSNAGDAAYLAAARSSHTLLVPTASGLLMPATRVVHVGGSGGGVGAARLLGRADPQHLLLAHPQISDHICRYVCTTSVAKQQCPIVELCERCMLGNECYADIRMIVSANAPSVMLWRAKSTLLPATC